MKTPRFRKKCNKCGRVSLHPIYQTTCGLRGRPAREPCTGTVEPYSGDFDDAVFNLLAAAKYVQQTTKDEDKAMNHRMLDYAIEDLETWMSEGSNTPESMGWVGKDGLP